VVGLQRMLHAQQEAKTQDCEHTCPALQGQTSDLAGASKDPKFRGEPFVDCRGFRR
jgi:hypothetical protein